MIERMGFLYFYHYITADIVVTRLLLWLLLFLYLWPTYYSYTYGNLHILILITYLSYT